MLGGTCGRSGTHLRYCSKDELANEEVCVWRIEDGDNQVQDFDIGDLGRMDNIYQPGIEPEEFDIPVLGYLRQPNRLEAELRCIRR